MSDSTRTIRSRHRRSPCFRVPAGHRPHSVDIRTTGERRALVGKSNAPEWALGLRAPRTGIRVTKRIPHRPAFTTEGLETLSGAGASAKRGFA
jgi:hypothetical protein